MSSPSIGTPEQPNQEWTFTVPLYLKSIHGDNAWRHLFPLFSRHVIGGYYARNFVLGPLLVTTRDAHTDLTQWDLLFPLLSLSARDLRTSVEQLAVPRSIGQAKTDRLEKPICYIPAALWLL